MKNTYDRYEHNEMEPILAMDVAIVTCDTLSTIYEDDALLISALREQGLDAQTVVWNDTSFDWSIPRIAVIRSTWDYHHHYSTFLEWLDTATQKTNLWNPPALIRWNSHKFYLRDLAEQNIPFLPTTWLPQGTQADLNTIMQAKNWSKVVIKPAVSASAYATMLVTLDQVEQGQAHLTNLLTTHDMLVQLFQPSVTTYGERSLIFIDGQFTHSVRRHPELGLSLENQTNEFEIVPPQVDELKLAQKILSLLPVMPLYARVDMIRDLHHELLLMELEVTEPGLFLTAAPYAAQRFADAIKGKLQ